jgi:beta-galactosidase
MGNGKTLLMGSFPASGYELHHGKETRALFASFLSMACSTARLRVDDNEVQTRIHEGEGGSYLWVTNPTRQTRPVTISLNPELGRFAMGDDKWGKLAVKVSGSTVAVTVPARDAAVIALH